jgi:hypothetical protein
MDTRLVFDLVRLVSYKTPRVEQQAFKRLVRDDFRSMANNGGGGTSLELVSAVFEAV